MQHLSKLTVYHWKKPTDFTTKSIPIPLIFELILDDNEIKIVHTFGKNEVTSAQKMEKFSKFGVGGGLCFLMNKLKNKDTPPTPNKNK